MAFSTCRIAPVQVGLLLVKLVVVKLLYVPEPIPMPIRRRTTPSCWAEPYLRAFMLDSLLIRRDTGGIGGNAVVPNIPIVLGIGAGAGGVDKPLVLIGGVVEHHVEDDANVMLLGLRR